jgi:hypothetical protein
MAILDEFIHYQKKRNFYFIMTSSIDPADIEMAKNTMSLKIILRNL